jgi:methyl-accepting chemotaxis protein
MRLSVRTKLFGAFGVILVLMLIVGLLGVKSLATADQDSDDMYNHAVAPLAEFGIARAKFNENRALLNNHILERDRAAQAEVETNIQANDKLISDKLAVVAKTLQSDEARASFASLQEQLSAAVAARAKVMEASSAGRQDEAYRLNKELVVPVLAKAIEDFDEIYDSKVKLADAENDEITSTVHSARNAALILMIVALGLGLGIAFVVSRAITSGVGKMLVAANGIAEGDVNQTVDIRSRDELGETGEAFTRMIEYLREMAGTAERVAAGDLTVDVQPRSEHDLLGNAFQKLVTDLSDVVGQISSQASTVSSASQQMASTSEETGRAVGEIAAAISDVAQGAERQVRMVESTRAAVTEASRAATVSAETAAVTTTAAGHAREVAREGVGAAERASEAIREVAPASQEISSAIGELSNRSERIGGIVDAITGIAEQTNLLALNAAIEAARAGEQGRGFAVVAEESQSAAGQISSLIGEMQTETRRVVQVVNDGARRTEEGVTTVEETRSAFEQIGTAVEDMNGRVSEIAAAVEQINAEAARVEQDIVEVASVAEESSASTEQVSASTQQTSASTQEIAASAQSLASTAEDLNRLVNRFQLV